MAELGTASDDADVARDVTISTRAVEIVRGRDPDIRYQAINIFSDKRAAPYSRRTIVAQLELKGIAVILPNLARDVLPAPI